MRLWRQVMSTGDWYSMEALPYVGEPWLFVYVYAERPW